jgi:hypothetical protein
MLKFRPGHFGRAQHFPGAGVGHVHVAFWAGVRLKFRQTCLQETWSFPAVCVHVQSYVHPSLQLSPTAYTLLASLGSKQPEQTGFLQHSPGGASRRQFAGTELYVAHNSLHWTAVCVLFSWIHSHSLSQPSFHFSPRL